jgi:hypothetical protein|eukprot:scaffold141_cov238-Chaetoceros_neogracile.AAC.7
MDDVQNKAPVLDVENEQDNPAFVESAWDHLHNEADEDDEDDEDDGLGMSCGNTVPTNTSTRDMIMARIFIFAVLISIIVVFMVLARNRKD